MRNELQQTMQILEMKHFWIIWITLTIDNSFYKVPKSVTQKHHLQVLKAKDTKKYSH